MLNKINSYSSFSTLFDIDMKNIFKIIYMEVGQIIKIL